MDRPLAEHIEGETGGGAIWGMSWLLTWFSHTTPGLPQSARLFDLFMASHPLMPLYVGAVAVQASRTWTDHRNRIEMLRAGDSPDT